MAKSTTPSHAWKPSKPTPDFPLSFHPSGRFSKRLKGRFIYFGRWANVVAGELIPVENFTEAAAAARMEYDRQWPYLVRGERPPVVSGSQSDGLTIRVLANEFLTFKSGRVETGELTTYALSEYHRTCAVLVKFFGPDRRVDDLRPHDFESLRLELAKGCSLVTLRSKVNRARVVFKYASDAELLDRPVAYGKSFDRPAESKIRAERNAAGERLFERDDLVRMLVATDGRPVDIDGESVTVPRSPIMRSIILLAMNAGFGNTDIASLPRSAVNLTTAWVKFPRVKTAVARWIPLWPETVAALTEAQAIRPAPADPADDHLFFLTERGTPYVRMQPSKTQEHRHVCINALARRFELLLKALKIEGRRGLGFYTLRHVFETVAGGCRDQVAVDAIMGHADQSMAGQYRERISDERLRAVTDYVHNWLFGSAVKPVKKTTTRTAKSSAN